MKYLASDLLKRILPNQIANTVARTIKVVNSLNIETCKHFSPVYRGINQEIIQDYKHSQFRYELVLMNFN